jgi:hypothetical protein
MTPNPCAGRINVMDETVIRRPECLRWVTVLRACRLPRTHLLLLIMGWMLVGFLLPPAIGRAMPDKEGDVELDAERQAILQAHPEWMADVRAALIAGIICAGMSPEMVRAAWGRPTRISASSELGQPETWHYAGRPSIVERLGGQWRHDPEAHEWTVSFINGQVVMWTD